MPAELVKIFAIINLLKGLEHHMNIFLRFIQLNQFFAYMRQWFVNFFWLPQQALWRELLEGFLKLVSDFKEASQDFIFHFLHNKQVKKFKNH